VPQTGTNSRKEIEVLAVLRSRLFIVRKLKIFLNRAGEAGEQGPVIDEGFETHGTAVAL